MKRAYKRPRTENNCRFAEQYPRSKLWELMPDNVFLTTTEIGNLIGCTNQCAYTKLRELLAEGRVANRRVSRYIIWMRIGAGVGTL